MKKAGGHRRRRPTIPYRLVALGAASGGVVAWIPALAAPIGTAVAVVGVAGAASAAAARWQGGDGDDINSGHQHQLTPTDRGEQAEDQSPL